MYLQTFASLLSLVAFAPQALAAIYVTDPVSTSKCSATLPCTLTWKDDGNTPSLSTVGPCQIDLCTGSQTVQTCLQSISTSYDVSKNNTIVWHPDPHVGPTGQFYFVKFASLGYRDPTQPQYAYTAYSARFTLVGMMGAYNASIENGSAGVTIATQTMGKATSTAVILTNAATGTGASTATIVMPGSSTSGAVPMVSPHTFTSAAGVTLILGVGSIYLSLLVLGF